MKKFSFIIFICLLCFTGCQCSKDINIDISGSLSKAKDIGGKIKDIDLDISQGQAYHAVVVPGYGAPVSGNSGYEGYIKSVANFINDEKNNVNVIIFTGSYSTLENTSEAQAMNDYFNSLVNTDELANKGVHVYKEECAIVSWQNISNSKAILDENKIQPHKVTVFGDQARAEKLVAFATAKFNQGQDVSKNDSGSLDISLSYVDIDFEGYDFGTDEDKQKALIAAEMAGAYEAELGNEILRMRIEDWSSTYGYDVANNLVSKGCTEFAGFQ